MSNYYQPPGQPQYGGAPAPSPYGSPYPPQNSPYPPSAAPSPYQQSPASPYPPQPQYGAASPYQQQPQYAPPHPSAAGYPPQHAPSPYQQTPHQPHHQGYPPPTTSNSRPGSAHSQTDASYNPYDDPANRAAANPITGGPPPSNAASAYPDQASGGQHPGGPGAADGPVGPDGERGFISTAVGGGAGAFLGSKLFGGGKMGKIMGGAAGALAANFIEGKMKDKKPGSNSQQQHHQAGQTHGAGHGQHGHHGQYGQPQYAGAGAGGHHGHQHHGGGQGGYGQHGHYQPPPPQYHQGGHSHQPPQYGPGKW